MKATKLFGLGLASLMVFGFTASNVHAAGVVGTDATTTNVTIKDADTANLILKSTPSLFSFETSLNDTGSYTLAGTNKDNEQIVVYNDKSDQSWTVSAALTDNSLTATSGTYTVSTLSFNGGDAIGTGASNVVATNPTGATNSGTIGTDIEDLSITFSDPNGTLKSGDTLTGTINYTLNNVTDPA
ncbi:hypothetical protein IV38_GL000860 [Lactobacillus selangorensis]|uniref:WxL domain-containing protein n=1 Tax=Lactobacillus selangorensis TaxID=81857 RepID=A0A0R2FJ17_9LACO|nr:hypothetical protein [Lactobacillus selangorensis]KRN28657.1 hypothetical protein IV38_GL000860 [Lactobacillus selangorensis]KRN32933.1 hypothetical protein IV40_GL000993 [Lactobacillus selangorensis]